MLMKTRKVTVLGTVIKLCADVIRMSGSADLKQQKSLQSNRLISGKSPLPLLKVTCVDDKTAS